MRLMNFILLMKSLLVKLKLIKNIFSEHLKNPCLYYFYRDLSSAGERYAEDVGAPGSTPGDPIHKMIC